MACSSGSEDGQKRKALNRHENVRHNVMESNPMLLKLLSEKEGNVNVKRDHPLLIAKRVNVKENHLALPVEEVAVRKSHVLMPLQEAVVGCKEHHPRSVVDCMSVIDAIEDTNKHKDLSVLLNLLNKGADVHKRSGFGGLTSLHITNSSDVVFILWEFGADINATDQENNTPLHLAANKNNWKVIEALLILGARADIKNSARRVVGHFMSDIYEGRSSCFGYGCHSNYGRPYYPYRPSRISFRIEHTSFADMYNKGSLFFDQLKNNIKELMIKFKQAGYKNELTDMMISRDDNTFDGFASQCSLEVKKMKEVNLSLYNLLIKGLTECSYAANNELCDTIESEQFVKDFPLYHSILRSHLRIAKRRHTLLNEAGYSFDKCLKKTLNVQLPMEMYEMIFSYLRTSDLIWLNSAFNEDFVVTWD